VLELGRDDSGILVMPPEQVAFIVRPMDVSADERSSHAWKLPTYGRRDEADVSALCA